MSGRRASELLVDDNRANAATCSDERSLIHGAQHAQTLVLRQVGTVQALEFVAPGFRQRTATINALDYRPSATKGNPMLERGEYKEMPFHSETTCIAYCVKRPSEFRLVNTTETRKYTLAELSALYGSDDETSPLDKASGLVSPQQPDRLEQEVAPAGTQLSAADDTSIF